jgi:hypothetical protein
MLESVSQALGVIATGNNALEEFARGPQESLSTILPRTKNGERKGASVSSGVTTAIGAFKPLG